RQASRKSPRPDQGRGLYLRGYFRRGPQGQAQRRQGRPEIPQPGESGADLVRPRQAPALVQRRAEGRQEGKGSDDLIAVVAQRMKTPAPGRRFSFPPPRPPGVRDSGSPSPYSRPATSDTSRVSSSRAVSMPSDVSRSSRKDTLRKPTLPGTSSRMPGSRITAPGRLAIRAYRLATAPT